MSEGHTFWCHIRQRFQTLGGKGLPGPGSDAVVPEAPLGKEVEERIPAGVGSEDGPLRPFLPRFPLWEIPL